MTLDIDRHVDLKFSFKLTGSVYLWWMTFMFVLYVYNAVSIPLRASFPLTQGTNFTPIGTLRGPPEVQWVGLLVMWILLDLLVDVLCVLDIILVQSHLTPQESRENNNHNQVSVVRVYPSTYSI